MTGGQLAVLHANVQNTRIGGECREVTSISLLLYFNGGAESGGFQIPISSPQLSPRVVEKKPCPKEPPNVSGESH